MSIERKQFLPIMEQDLVLTDEEATKLKSLYNRCFLEKEGSYGLFHDIVMRKRTPNFSDVEVFVGRFKCIYLKSLFYLCKVSAHFTDKINNVSETIVQYGWNENLKKAKNSAAYAFLEEVEYKYKFYWKQPERVIGLSNFRGHCYTVPVLVPLFHDVRFIEALEGAKKYFVSEEPDNRSIVMSLFLIYQWYTNASLKGQLTINATPTGYEKKYKNAIVIEKQNGQAKPCLWIDRYLMKLIKILGCGADKDFLAPGGSETTLFFHLTELIDKEFRKKKISNTFGDIFRVILKCKIWCGKCGLSEKAWVERFMIRIYITEGTEVSLLDYVNNPLMLLKDELYCPGIDDSGCDGQVAETKKFCFVELPHLLVFAIHCHGSDAQPHKFTSLFPDDLDIKKDGQIWQYEKYSMSNQIFRYKYSPKLKRQVAFDGHTFVYLRSTCGWLEINNSKVYGVKSLPTTHVGAVLLIYRMKRDSLTYPRAQDVLPPREDGDLSYLQID